MEFMVKKLAEALAARKNPDLVIIAREFLRDPYWPVHAAAALGETISWPGQYLRAAPPKSPARERVGNKPIGNKS